MDQGPTAELLERIGFDAALEREAFARLAALDASGCFERLSRIVDGLRLGLPVEDGRQVVVLIGELLLTANRVLHGQRDDDEVFAAQRLRLCDEISRCESAERARRRFGEQLGALLEAWDRSDEQTHPIVQRAGAYVEANHQSRIYLADIAGHLGVSPNYLSRLFRRETGMTLTSFVQRVRLARARRLLADDERRISEIAYLVGYQNYRDFYRNFVKYEHASPREMRRRLQASRRSS